MGSETRSSSARQPVGRGPKVRAAVLAATIAELAERGCTSLTVENVAKRAGVHKTTVYRRWIDRERLVVDALTEHIATEIPVPEEESIEATLRALARGLVDLLMSQIGRAIIATMLSDAVYTPEIAEIRQQVFEDRFRSAEPVITRAIERGELPANTEPVELIKTLVAPIYFRHLIAGEPIDEETAEHAAQVALASARAGVLVRSGQTG